MPYGSGPRHGRWRTWIRVHTPDWLYYGVGFVVPKTRDCGAHEWYNRDGVLDGCYHCVQTRPHHAVDVGGSPHNDRPVERYQLSETEALDAMAEFLWLHAGHTADTPGDLARLILRDDSDGVPEDAAVWTDWIACIRKVKGLDASYEAVLRDVSAGGGWIGRETAVWLAKREGPSGAEPKPPGDMREP